MILPRIPIWKLPDYIKEFKAVPVSPGFSYTSGSNNHFLAVNELRDLIGKNVDCQN